MIITKDSHLDHGLTLAHITWLLMKYGDAEGFRIETVDLPVELPLIPCALIGPAMGDAPVPEAAVHYARRGDRAGESRMVMRGPVPTRKLTVVMGPHDGHTILFTAYGGAQAAREPFDPALTDEERSASKAFWADHALASLEHRV